MDKDLEVVVVGIEACRLAEEHSVFSMRVPSH